jgi:hypothetical protein
MMADRIPEAHRSETEAAASPSGADRHGRFGHGHEHRGDSSWGVAMSGGHKCMLFGAVAAPCSLLREVHYEFSLHHGNFM